ncbi:MAG TPA: P1 family peptidase [Roseiflexaceae bacterium]|nr:P1 family peptidase [Roseiflexaceae bacterium]
MNQTLTAIHGIAVGHAQDEESLTGCTVVLLPDGTTCGVDVRGGGPGTRETDLLDPSAMVQHVHAICLAGGSAFGLAAATGVMAWLHERGIGFDTGSARVPIVPAAVLFDLGMGARDRWPDEAMGRAACAVASTAPVPEGTIGAGTGASVGKIFGMAAATKSGVGSAALQLPGGVSIAALAVTNAFGDVRREDGTILAGARQDDGGFVDTAAFLRSEQARVMFGGLNTTLAVVGTDATLDKAGCRKLAQMAQDALARTIRPIHTPFDGDIVFAVATNARPAPHMTMLGSAAADVLAAAIMRSVTTATAAGGLPAIRDLPQHT